MAVRPAAPELAALPPELLERIIEHVDSRADLLSLALTCCLLRYIVIPYHLSYHTAIVRGADLEYFDHLLDQPVLALRVRDLTIVSEVAHTRVLPYEGRYGEEGSVDTEDDTIDPVSKDSVCPLSTSMLPAVKRMKNLRRLSVQGGHWPCPSCLYSLLQVALIDLPRVERIYCDFMVEWQQSSVLPALRGPDRRHLRVLAIHSVDMPLAEWDEFCYLLRSLPMLEELFLPSFAFEPFSDDDLPPARASLPALRRLRTLAIPRIDDETGILSHVFALMHDHPSLEEIIWTWVQWAIAPDYAPPHIPHLRRVRDQSYFSSFLRFFLPAQPRCALALEALEYTGRIEPALLGALDPAALRELRVAAHVHFRTLRTLARMFPNVEVLALPDRSKHTMAPHAAAAAWRRARWALAAKGDTCHCILRYPALDDVCKLFPRLRSVRGTRACFTACYCIDRWRKAYLTPAPSATMRADMLKMLARVRSRWPLLEVLEGWLVRPDSNGDPVLYKDRAPSPLVVTGERFASVRFFKAVLREDGYSLAYHYGPLPG